MGACIMRTVDRIQEILDSKNIKASKMMKDLGFSSGLFSQWKSGKQEVSLEKIINIANYFDCSIDYLLGRTSNPNTYSINNQDTTINGTQANVIHKNNDDDLNDIKNTLNQLSKANRFRAIADILDLIDEKYLKNKE